MAIERTRLIVLVAIFATTALGVRTATGYRLHQKRQPDWTAVPYQIGGWSGLDAQFDPLYGSDPSDTSLLRVYRKADRPPIIVYVGFFGDLAAILDIHTPEICYPAQGWTVVSSSKWSAGTLGSTWIPAREMVADKNGDRRLVVWWYNAGSRPFEARMRYVFAMLAMSTFTGRTDGSLVRLETPLNTQQSDAEARTQEFQKSFLPELQKALPR
jgi:EpsI family protein